MSLKKLFERFLFPTYFNRKRKGYSLLEPLHTPEYPEKAHGHDSLTHAEENVGTIAERDEWLRQVGTRSPNSIGQSLNL